MEFDKENCRFYVYTEYKRGKHAQGIHNALVTVWRGSVCGYSTVARWVVDFRSELVCFYWVPKLLSDVQKENPVRCAMNLKERLVRYGEDRYSLYAVENEMWVRFDEERTRTTAKAWIPQEGTRPQVIRHRLTHRKCLFIIVFTADLKCNIEA